jgi:phosphohistidine swiveling domain-containing protein
LVNLAQGVIWQKGYRKDMQYHGFYCYENLFKELAKRRKVKDWQTLSFLFPWEAEGYIKSSRPIIEELERRRKFSVFIVSKDGLSILVDKSAKTFAKKLGSLEDYAVIKELKGQVAYTGNVKGKVKIVQTRADMAKMNRGDILMSQATSPDLLPAMKKAGAIVTNTGGLICHAAITSRELKIPCIVGTAKATLVFKDGDLVEVDANKGIVWKIKSR